MSVSLRLGDCMEVMQSLKEGSVELVLCDPPYGLEFMGADWDRLQGYTTDTGFKGLVLPRQRKRNVQCPECGLWIYSHAPNVCSCGGVRRLQMITMQSWHVGWTAGAFKALVPGGELWAFSSSRTAHRLAGAMDSVGFVDISLKAWAYGSGFPKGLNIGKSIDRILGTERKVVGQAKGIGSNSGESRYNWNNPEDEKNRSLYDMTAPGSPEAARWEGWNTALKPSWEPLVVGRKP